ncbi:hypothetical protein FBU59_004471, partial [Linderina macrospora]
MNPEERANYIDDEEVEHEETYVDENDVAEDIEDSGEPMDDDMMDEDDNQEAGPSANDEVLLEDDSIQGFFTHKEPVFSIDMHPTDQNVV